ncbi:hypothetical protein HHK36_019314 [Tetracentron sinense]|uniref:Uncharacterized protein n=1 Tax=Tetracentron sinense TaxID=13715 RepID=A0A835D9H9_TETSI|nr:hypothetical protein HHK36_019314 [Tetracentron sinense]
MEIPLQAISSTQGEKEKEKGDNGASSSQAIEEKDKGQQEPTLTEGKDKETEADRSSTCPVTDFIEMMLLDACFIVELLSHDRDTSGEIESNDIDFQMPWLKPVLMRDLLPFFILQRVYNISTGRPIDATNQEEGSVPRLFFRFFDLAFLGPIPQRYENFQIDHLLDLFHKSFTPSIPQEGREYRPSDQSIQCVTLLQSSGIKFKPHKAPESFFDIKFKRRLLENTPLVISFAFYTMNIRRNVLEIPPITINDFTRTLFINCIALEHCRPHRSMYFTTYVAFMSCLLNSPRDVAFLSAEGIISNSSENDQYVTDLFSELGKNIVFNIRDCYLSKQFRDVEACYSSNRATFIRTYFRSPWTVISVLSASALLILTAIQSTMAIVSFLSPVVVTAS